MDPDLTNFCTSDADTGPQDYPDPDQEDTMMMPHLPAERTALELLEAGGADDVPREALHDLPGRMAHQVADRTLCTIQYKGNWRWPAYHHQRSYTLNVKSD